MKEQIEQLSKIVTQSKRMVFFGGAGISTESNIPDFRSEQGVYHMKDGSRYSPEQMLSRTFYERHTKEFYEFYKSKMIYEEAKPNRGHMALAKLEKMGNLKAVITQNIDGLHQAAGSKVVWELHGSVHRNYCTTCHACYDMRYILKQEGIPVCNKCKGHIKPDVVLYEEALQDEVVEAAIQAIKQADTLLVGGTSLVVYPAAGLLRYFQGENLVLINKSVTPYDNQADLVLHDGFGDVMEKAMEQL